MKDDEEWGSPSMVTDEHKALLREIRNAVPALMSAINQNSLFVLSTMQFDVKEETSPAELAKRLRDLKEMDYDPIFGEPPEHLVEVFSDAVVYMTNYLNGLPDYENVVSITSDQQLRKLKKKLDSIKLDSLYGLIEAWASKLSQELDKLYQSQSENMVDVYNAIEELPECVNHADKSVLNEIREAKYKHCRECLKTGFQQFVTMKTKSSMTRNMRHSDSIPYALEL